ncbi:MAG: GMC family oxidoreductase N-terminal domain-containing protein [Gammaproteobacteria bacterium]
MYDYIIVGGGAAGCVLAARLSESGAAKVALLEAGPVDKKAAIHRPVSFADLITGPLTWGYHSQGVAQTNNRTIALAQGRVLGGGSSINAQVFTRGCAQDYDRWANEEGCPGWSFQEVLPYFIRAEGNEIFSGTYHGDEGPLGVSNLRSPNVLSKRFVQACQQLGMPYNPDFNGPRQDGCGLYQVTQRDGQRCSAAVGYLRPALGRPNLTVLTDCLATGLLIEKQRAVGVTYRRNGRTETVRASQEVIITAGAIGSPKLLLLSGIGPAEQLRKLGIAVVQDLAGVGQNLQDHFDIDIVYELNGNSSLDKYRKPHWKLWAGLQYECFRSGPVTSNLAEGGAFWYSSQSADKPADTPDLQFHFLPAAGVEAGVPALPSGSGCTLNSYFVRPRSRGSVQLQSTDPAVAPYINPNYIAEPYDLQVAVEGIRLSREIMQQTAFRKYLKKEHFPGESVSSQAELEDYARQFGRTSYHLAGTCKMGVAADAVVDPQLRVHGIDGLRVCDSSVMPSLVSSNTNAPSIMIGEKASALIQGDV